MAKQCELTAVKPQSGNNVSHSCRRTRRRFLPNIQTVSFKSDALDTIFKLKVNAAAIRTVEHNGGLDKFLLNTSNLKLPQRALEIKKKIQAKQAA